jgi:hypothetical protein
MPRGLGDNPLKREKRTRRAGTQTAYVVPALESPPDLQADAVAPESIHASSSSSRSYNDVFFMRRPEDSGAAANGAHETTSFDASSGTAPIAAAQAPDLPDVPEASPSPSLEPAPVEIAAIDVAAPIATPIETPPVVDIAAPTEVPFEVSASSPAPEEAAPGPSVAVETPPAVQASQPIQPESADQADSQEEKSGFFGRIFGKLRK